MTRSLLADWGKEGTRRGKDGTIKILDPKTPNSWGRRVDTGKLGKVVKFRRTRGRRGRGVTPGGAAWWSR